MHRKIICGNIFDVLPALEKHDVLIADPPDGIGLGYNEFDDVASPGEYSLFLYRLMSYAATVAPIVWISYNAKWQYIVGREVCQFLDNWLDWEAKPFVQTFTFGQNRKNDCGNGHRPILRLKHKDAPLYPEQIKVPSWRQQNGDKRAKPGGKVPLDVWDFPRVTGNSKQRRSWHPTQLNELLVKRMIEFSTQPGGTVLDCFSGTGTVFRATENRSVTGVEMDSKYAEKIAKENNATLERFTP